MTYSYSTIHTHHFLPPSYTQPIMQTYENICRYTIYEENIKANMRFSMVIWILEWVKRAMITSHKSLGNFVLDFVFVLTTCFASPNLKYKYVYTMG